MGGYARVMSDSPQWNYSRPVLHYVAGNYGWKRAFGMAGISHSDVDFISCYDAFTFTTLIQLEANGFCGPGEAGEFVKGGRLQIDHQLPCNLSGGHLSEGYTHGVQMVIENVRQLVDPGIHVVVREVAEIARTSAHKYRWIVNESRKKA